MLRSDRGLGGSLIQGGAGSNSASQIKYKKSRIRPDGSTSLLQCAKLDFKLGHRLPRVVLPKLAQASLHPQACPDLSYIIDQLINDIIN